MTTAKRAQTRPVVFLERKRSGPDASGGAMTGNNKTASALRRTIGSTRTVPVLPGSALQTSYTAWLRHGRQCLKCYESGDPKRGCRRGKALWQIYFAERVAAGLERGPNPPRA